MIQDIEGISKQKEKFDHIKKKFLLPYFRYKKSPKLCIGVL